MTEPRSPVVCAVIVTFKPAIAPLEELLRALIPQVSHAIVVDNSPAEDSDVQDLIDSLGSERTTLIRLGGNRGVAKGLNTGIEHARLQKADFVLLSDQDSLPAADMVMRLLEGYQHVSKSGMPVAAIGPTFTDLHTGTTFPFQAQVAGKFFYGHVRPDAQRPDVEALTLITSGTLIPLAVLDTIGAMREELFIDKVDLEWCLRARAKGFSIYGTGRAKMFQRLGERHLRVWWLRWRNESAYSPVRVYYQVRNFFALCSFSYIPLRWKLRQAWFTFGVAYSQIVFGSERISTARMVLSGAFDGLRGRMGPLDR
jgi:rhamnosyltransferase